MDAVFAHLFDHSNGSGNNYAEFVLIHDIDDNMCGYNMDKDTFIKKLKYVSKTHNIKYFTKKIKRYRVDEMTMEMCDDDIRVYKQTCGANCLVNDQLLCISFNRDKQPYHQFPCTKNLNEISFIHRLTFRLHNRLFLNFEIQKMMDQRQVFKIYFNYNHDKTTEMGTIVDIMNEFTKSLLASTC